MDEEGVGGIRMFGYSFGGIWWICLDVSILLTWSAVCCHILQRLKLLSLHLMLVPDLNVVFEVYHTAVVARLHHQILLLRAQRQILTRRLLSRELRMRG